MTLATIACNWFVSPGHNAVSYRVIGLATLAILVGLAFISPRWTRDRRSIGTAQSVAGLYLSLTAVAVAVLAGVVALGSPHLAGDPLSVEGIVLLLSLVMLTGSAMTLAGSAKLGRSAISGGCLLGFPFLICAVGDALLLSYVWLGPVAPATAAQCAAGPTGRVAWGFAVASGVVSLGVLAAPLAVLARQIDLGGMLLPVVVGVGSETLFIVLRGPASWYADARFAGMEYLLVGAALGGLIFAVALLAGRAPRRQAVTIADGGVAVWRDAA